ncbi:hypothetical protein LTR92_002312 [Exophiala xenobiotica]|nr:hypothetical protein LTR92_002312 [Exophiala xenobiotica]KAK5450886.1 hypothetical protein LTR18_000902 [Exophiala xenobiotica]
MSGLEVIGGISGVIGIIDASIKTYDSAYKDMKLGDTFKAVRRQLPIILDTLQTCQNHLEPTNDLIPTEVWEALKETVVTCHDKAGNLRGIFEKVIISHGDGWKTQYLKTVKRLGKGNTVEELMKSITEDVRVIVDHRSVQSANPGLKAALDKIIEEMKSVKPSVPEEEFAGFSFNSYAGAMTNNVNSGSGQLHSGSGNLINNNGPVNTIHKPPTDFNFRGPVGPCLNQAPTIEPSFFVGRRSEIDAIRDILKPGDTHGEHRRLVLGGMGGIGKTQLAIAYAQRHHKFYQSVFWLNAASEAALKDSFRSVAELIFDVQEPGLLDDERNHAQVGRWLSDINNTQWLLIFDNYDDPTQFEIEKYYPLASHGNIIITTRRPDKVIGSELKLGPLQNKIDDGLEILQSRSRQQNVASDPHAKRLAERLAGLPLALATAGAYLRHNITFESYLREYEARFVVDARLPLQLQDYQNRTLHTTWDISYSRLQKEDPIAAKLLKLLAYFDNQSLWYKLFSAGFNSASPEWLHDVIATDLSFASVMRSLTDYCFIEVQTAPSSWSMHNCIHDWALAMLNKDLDGPQLWYVFDCVAVSIKGADQDSFGRLIYNHLAAHAIRLVRVGFQGSTPIVHIPPSRLTDAQRIAELLRLQIRHEPAEQLYRHVLAGYEQELGPTHPSTLDTVNNLGRLYYVQGNLTLAEEMYRRALVGYEKNFLSKTIPAFNTSFNLGLLFRRQGKAEEARAIFHRGLSGAQEMLGPGHSLILNFARKLEEVRIGKETEEKQVQNINAGQVIRRKEKSRLKHLLPQRSSKTKHNTYAGGGIGRDPE